jgi:hypothetical protein
MVLRVVSSSSRIIEFGVDKPYLDKVFLREILSKPADRELGAGRSIFSGSSCQLNFWH